MRLCVDVNGTMFQDESNIIATVIAGRKFLPKQTGDFMLVGVAGMVEGAVYTRLCAFVPRFENVSSDGIGHCCHLCSGEKPYFSVDDKAEDVTNGTRRCEVCFRRRRGCYRFCETESVWGAPINRKTEDAFISYPD